MIFILKFHRGKLFGIYSMPQVLLDNIIITHQMFKVNEERQFCSSVRTKRSQSAPVQQMQNEGKQYRTLLSIFAENINSIVRLHRSCLGDADSYPKIKASREERHSVVEQLEKIYGKMEDKMMKDAINRNTIIKKSIEDYAQEFKTAFPDWVQIKKSDSEQQEVDNQDHLGKEYLSERRQSTINSSPKRPLSSKETRNTKTTLIHQAYQALQSNQLAQAYKIKLITANQNPEAKKEKDGTIKMNKIPSRAKKILLNNKNRYDDTPSNKQKEYQQFLFNGEEIMINERRFKQNPKQYESQSQHTSYSRRQSTKRMLNLKFSQRKSINEVEKMQIQNRILMINSVLSVNLVQPQGYRPKSRCWQNYFN